jgi:uncharacterized membrane protein
MASSGLSSPLGIAGVILVVVGIILTAIGLIILLVNANKTKPWYLWFTLIAGIVLGIIGGIMLAIELSTAEDSSRYVETEYGISYDPSRVKRYA